jgi:hypothetical protein
MLLILWLLDELPVPEDPPPGETPDARAGIDPWG